MQNMILATPVLSDAATLSGSTGAGDFGIANLQKMSLKQLYRVMGNSVSITADLGAAKLVNFVALIGHSLSPTASVRVRAGSTNAVGAATFDTGLLPANSDQAAYVATGYSNAKNLFMNFFAPQTFRYWFIDISDTSATYIDIGRLYISKAFQPKTNMDYGLAESISDPSLVKRTVSGDRVPREFVKYKVAEFTLAYLSEADAYGELFTIENMCGITRDVLFIPDPDQKDFLQRRSYYGNMASIQPKVYFSFSLYSKAFRIEEIPA